MKAAAAHADSAQLASLAIAELAEMGLTSGQAAIMPGGNTHSRIADSPSGRSAAADGHRRADRLCHSGAGLAAVGGRLYRRQMGRPRDAALDALFRAPGAGLRHSPAGRAPASRKDAGPPALARPR